MWISFENMKIDCPNTTVKYIIADKTGGPKHKSPLKWAENHMRSLRRITAKITETYGTTGYTECWGYEPPQSDQNTQHANQHTVRRISKKNQRIVSKSLPLKYEIRVPKDTEEAYKIDKENNNTLWSEAINKELNALNSYKTFKLVKNNDFKSLKKEGFQFSRLRMIFDVKQDLRRKARLVIGDHMVDSTGHKVYASIMKQHSSRIIEVIAKANNCPMPKIGQRKTW